MDPVGGSISGVRTRANMVLLVPESIHELLATEAAIEKLGARSIAPDEAGQLPRNDPVVLRTPNAPTGADKRQLLIGRTDGGRTLTLVIERTIDPSTWLIVTGWNSTSGERTLLGEDR